MQIFLSRVILYVREVTYLRAFYETHFGFRTIEEIADEWAVLSAGPVELALHRVGPAFRDFPPGTGASNAKLVFTVAGLPELRRKLEQAGASIGAVKRYPGFAYSLCDGRDPEGNVFQLSEPDGESR